MKKIALALVTLMGLTGCVSLHAPMVRKSDGAKYDCSSWGFGLLGTPSAFYIKNQCIKTQEALGFELVKSTDTAVTNPMAKRRY